MAWLQGGIDRTRDGYVRLVTPITRRAFIALILVAAFVLAAGGVGSLVPSGFLPEEDQGAFMAELQLPDAASTNRTLESLTQVEGLIAGKPWLQSLLHGQRLQPDRRPRPVQPRAGGRRAEAVRRAQGQPSLSVFAALDELNAAFRQIPSANVFAFNLPPIMGLGNSSGFEFQIAEPGRRAAGGARAGGARPDGRGPERPELTGVFTTYGAATPQIYLKLDRERAQTLGIGISDIFSALQTTMGGTYVNDFNRFGRTWQVKIQADADERKKVEDIFRVRVRTSNGRPGAPCRRWPTSSSSPRRAR